MKTKMILFFVILSFIPALNMQGSLLSFDYEPVAICLGSIIFPHSINPDLNIYYKGKKLPLDIEPQSKKVKIVPYALEEIKSKQKFHIIICQECKPASKENTVQYLYVPQNSAYKFYTLSGSKKYNQHQEIEGCSWNVTQESLLEDRIIPDNTIIFLFNPHFIQNLHVKSWPQHNNTRILPDIVILPTISEDQLITAMAAGRLAAIDIDSMHSKNKELTRQIHKTAILSLKP